MPIAVRPLDYAEIHLLDGMPPPEWQLDIVGLFRLQYSEPYFKAFVALSDGDIVGVGNVVINGQTGWLGNIIVLESHRGQGIGQALVLALCDCCQANGCTSIQLIATEMGLPLYVKLGFQMAENYLFMKGNGLPKPPDPSMLMPLDPDNFEDLLALDREATGEDRALLLQKFATGAWVWMEQGQLGGFWLPQLGDGLIVAQWERAGIGLLQLKHSKQTGLPANLPEANRLAVAYLESEGFAIARTAPRLYLGSDTVRHPTMIYSRVSGYLG